MKHISHIILSSRGSAAKLLVPVPKHFESVPKFLKIKFKIQWLLLYPFLKYHFPQRLKSFKTTWKKLKIIDKWVRPKFSELEAQNHKWIMLLWTRPNSTNSNLTHNLHSCLVFPRGPGVITLRSCGKLGTWLATLLTISLKDLGQSHFSSTANLIHNLHSCSLFPKYLGRSHFSSAVKIAQNTI